MKEKEGTIYAVDDCAGRACWRGKIHGALGGLFKAGDDIEQHALAALARPEDGEKFVFIDINRDIADRVRHLMARIEGLCDVLEAEHYFSFFVVHGQSHLSRRVSTTPSRAPTMPIRIMPQRISATS